MEAGPSLGVFGIALIISLLCIYYQICATKIVHITEYALYVFTGVFVTRSLQGIICLPSLNVSFNLLF